VSVFHAVHARTAGQLQALLMRIIKRIMKLLTRIGYLQGMAYLTEADPDIALVPLQQAACTYRIAFGPRAGQKVLTLQTVPSQEAPATPQRCVNEQGFEGACRGALRHQPALQTRTLEPLYHPPRSS
jgi:hypothetical protein